MGKSMITEQSQVNEQVIKRFALLKSNNRLGHAYLFIGPMNIGKSETALGVAKFLNCENPRHNIFCAECPSCLKISHGNHPDIHTIDSKETETIKIEQIRGLIEQIQLRPFEGKIKVFIIKNVETLTLEGANALLKTLEEPSQNSLLLLTTAVVEKNLDTIRSRCHAVTFFPSSNARLADELRKDYAIAESASHFLAYFSEGCRGRARHLADKNFFACKNQAIDLLIFSRNSEDYLKKIFTDKEKIREVLNILLMWFRDLLLLKTGGDESRLINLDRLKDLRKYESQYTFAQINEIIAQIVKATGLLEENLNVKIALSLIKERLWRR